MDQNIGQIKLAEISQEAKRAYLDYAMSVIVARALPDTRDGLKPVHRRILYAMYQMGLTSGAKFTKCAKIVGETMGKYHPHGDMAIYDSLVRLAQDFSMRYPLIKGQGNFGSIDGDPPAAMRYTEAKLTAIAAELLTDIDKNTVDLIDNFDATAKEPVFLPAKLPNLLLMGSDGIAVGMATKIPPHNLTEVIDATVYMIKKGQVSLPKLEIKKINLADEDLAANALNAQFEVETTTEELLNYLKGPDFPTGAAIYDKKSLIEAYHTGKGKVVIQAKADIEETKENKFQIIVSEIPYQVNKALLVAKIASLVKERKIEGIADLRDESDRHGLRIVIELKKSAKPKSILNNLYHHTNLRTSFPFNMVALVGGIPQTLGLKQILYEFVKHRQQVVVKRTAFDLDAARKRAHILEGLKIALDNLDAVIATIKKSATQEIAKTNLMTKFGLTEIQATAILDLQLRRLAALERQKIEEEYEQIKKLISHLIELLKDPKKILAVINEELLAIKNKYQDPRRTKIYSQAIGEFSEEDLVAQEKCLITITRTGYLKRLSIGTYRLQRRGGKGVTGMATKEEDEILHFLATDTHQTILFFTDQGRVFATRVWDINEASRQSKGQAIINLIDIDQEEKIQSVLTIDHQTKNQGYLIMVTEKGLVKKTSLNKFTNIRRSGLIAIKLDKDDVLCWAKQTSGQDEILLVSRLGKAIRFKETDARPMGRDTRGVRGIRLAKDDYVVNMEVINNLQPPEDKRRKFFNDVLVITEKGLGKRTPLSHFHKQKRGGVGIKVAKVTQKTGPIICGTMVNQEINQVIITSKKAQVIKLTLKNIPQLGRATQGVILMRFSKTDDSVAAVACLT